MAESRKPTLAEEKLIGFLIKESNLDFPGWKTNLLVRTLDDGGMGSLSLYPEGKVCAGRKFGKRVSEYQFSDLDGVPVLASLNLDTNGELFELDVWKTNFGKLQQLPEV